MTNNLGRVLICGQDIANLMTSYASALKGHGYEAKTCLFRRNPLYMTNHYDYELAGGLRNFGNKYLRYGPQLLIRYFIFLNLFWRFDTFIYIWRSTFWPFKLDLFLLRLLRKKIIVVHCGSDVRYRPIQSKIDRFEFDLYYFDKDDNENFRKYIQQGCSFIRTFFTQLLTDKSGASIIALRSHATFQSRQSYFFRFPQATLLSAAKQARDKPLIIHAPTDRKGKGTRYVLETIEILKQKEIPFDFELIESKPNDYVLQRLQDADIVIDQPGPWFGRFGVEAMASGCALITGNRYDYYGINDESPAIHFTPSTLSLTKSLEELITDKDLRQDAMNKGYQYWEGFYSDSVFVDYIESVSMKENSEHVFYPLKNHKSLVLHYAENWFQRLIIQLLYRPQPHNHDNRSSKPRSNEISGS